MRQSKEPKLAKVLSIKRDEIGPRKVWEQYDSPTDFFSAIMKKQSLLAQLRARKQDDPKGAS